MVETIFSSPIWFQVILPFILIFTLVFAVLQKSKILGDGKKQIDALVALAIGLIAISFGYAMEIISYMIPFLAVSLVIILVFLLLVGFVYEPGKFELHANVKWAFMGIIAVAVTIAVLYFTGAWNYITEMVEEGGGSTVFVNVGFVVLIIIAIAAVLVGGKEKKESK